MKNRRTLGAALALAALLTSSACAHANAVANPCVRPAAPLASASPSADDTVALLTTAGQPAPEQAVQRVLASAVTTHAHLLTGVISSGLEAPTEAADTVLTADGRNPSSRKRDLGCKMRSIKAALARTAQAPSPRTPDVLAALRRLDGALAKDPASVKQIVLAGQVQSSVAPLDLTNPTVLADPVRAVNAVAAAGLLPHCRGWRVHLLPSGRGAHGQPLTATQDDQLQAVWRELFARCGGELVHYSATLSSFPAPGGQIAAPDTHQVALTTSGTTVVATLPDDVTFAVGSADLQPSSDSALEQIFTLIPSGDSDVVVQGHTDSSGSTSGNQALSLHRARAVLAWLSAHGVSPGRLRAVGRGAVEPLASNATAAGRAANRRTTVSFDRVDH